MTGPAWDAALRVAETANLLVAVDFDGTLAPTVDDPATARALPRSVAAVDELAQLDSTAVALVSGRHLAGLRSVAEATPEVILVGSHGAESLVNGEESGPTLSAREHDTLDALCRGIQAVAARFPGAHAEPKPSGCGLHTRLVAPADAEVAREAALAVVSALAGSASITERYGKDILEFTVRAADKGTALGWLRELTSATAVLFLGDDVTDEDGFRALSPGDVGIKVGTGDTAAEFRVADPIEVSELLATVATARQRAVSDVQRGRD